MPIAQVISSLHFLAYKLQHLPGWTRASYFVYLFVRKIRNALCRLFFESASIAFQFSEWLFDFGHP